MIAQIRVLEGLYKKKTLWIPAKFLTTIGAATLKKWKKHTAGEKSKADGKTVRRETRRETP